MQSAFTQWSDASHNPCSSRKSILCWDFEMFHFLHWGPSQYVMMRYLEVVCFITWVITLRSQQPPSPTASLTDNTCPYPQLLFHLQTTCWRLISTPDDKQKVLAIRIYCKWVGRRYTTCTLNTAFDSTQTMCWNSLVLTVHSHQVTVMRRHSLHTCSYSYSGWEVIKWYI